MKKFLIFLLFFTFIHAQQKLDPKIAWNTLPPEIQEKIVAFADDYQNLKWLTVKQEPWDKKNNLMIYNGDNNERRQDYKEVSINGLCVQYLYIHRSHKDTKTISFPVAPTKIISCYLANNYFVSLENGKICNLQERTIAASEPTHKGIVYDIEILNPRQKNNQLMVCSAGTDGWLILSDSKLKEKTAYNFRQEIGSNPVYIKFLSKKNLLLVESKNHDYVYFNDKLEVVEKIDHEKIKSLQLPKDTLVIGHPDSVLELIKLHRGCSFKTFAVLRALHLAVQKNRTYFLHEKEEKLFSEYPLLLAGLKRKEFIGKESKFIKSLYSVGSLMKKENKTINSFGMF